MVWFQGVTNQMKKNIQCVKLLDNNLTLRLLAGIPVPTFHNCCFLVVHPYTFVLAIIHGVFIWEVLTNMIRAQSIKYG